MAVDGPTRDPIARVLAALSSGDRRMESLGSVLGAREIKRSERRYSTLALVELHTTSGPRRVYVKVAKEMPTLEPETPTPAQRLGAEFDVLSSLQAAFGRDATVRVVRPVGLFAEVPAIVTEEVQGPTLLAWLQARASVWHGTRRWERATELCRLSGEFLRGFQAASAVSSREFELPEMRAYVDRRLEAVVARRWLGVDERWRRRVLDWFDATAAAVPLADLRVARAHGDYGLSNVLVGSSGITVLDFPMVAEGSFLHDVTHFYQALEQLAAHPRFSGALSRRLCRAFLAGFDPHLEPDRSLFQLFRLQHLACQLSRVSEGASGSVWGRYHDRRVGRRELAWLQARTLACGGAS